MLQIPVGMLALFEKIYFEVPILTVFWNIVENVQYLFGTDPDRNRVTWETPNSEAIPSVKSQ